MIVIEINYLYHVPKSTTHKTSSWNVMYIFTDIIGRHSLCYRNTGYLVGMVTVFETKPARYYRNLDFLLYKMAEHFWQISLLGFLACICYMFKSYPVITGQMPCYRGSNANKNKIV